MSDRRHARQGPITARADNPGCAPPRHGQGISTMRFSRSCAGVRPGSWSPNRLMGAGRCLSSPAMPQHLIVADRAALGMEHRHPGCGRISAGSSEGGSWPRLGRGRSCCAAMRASAGRWRLRKCRGLDREISDGMLSTRADRKPAAAGFSRAGSGGGTRSRADYGAWFHRDHAARVVS